jgi:exodeoxyribonuclease III
MKLVTWNVNSLKARLPRVLEFLAEHAPDIVCLQETKTTDEAFPAAELADAGYAAVHHSGGRWAGVAILARGVEPGDVAAGLPGEVDADECRWIEATVHGLRVASVYVPNGRALDSPAFPAKLAFLEAMRARVTQLHRSPLVVAGDVNVAPADLDVYDPALFVGSTHTSAAERDRLQAILDDGELVDAFRHLHPDEVGYTWWDYRAGHFHKKLGLRIDLVMVSRDLAAQLEHCGIERNYRKGAKPSDHAPLVADFATD